MSPRSLLVTLGLVLALLIDPVPATGASDADPVGTWPLSPEPAVVGGFDPPEDPWGSGHRGVDLAGRMGQPVLAALPGRVSYVGTIAGRGIVAVEHAGAAAGTRTTYQPVAATVSVGDRVVAGEVVGRLTAAGSHCFPAACLHWGWRRGETYLDPLRLVGGGPVRLLPLWRDSPLSTSASPSLPHARWTPALVPSGP